MHSLCKWFRGNLIRLGRFSCTVCTDPVQNFFLLGFLVRNIMPASRLVEGAVMRRHAAEPGAVTSTTFRVSQTRRWLAYREVRRRPARAAARAPRGAAVRTGPKGGLKIPPGSWVREHSSPVRKNGPVQAKHRGGAPVGEAARSQGPQAHPSQGEHIEGAPIGAPLPLSCSRE